MRSLVHYPYSYWLDLKYRIGVLVGSEPRTKGPDDGYPLPSPPLRYRVHGSVKPEGFLRVGRNCARDIEAILEGSGQSLSHYECVLDFGCGCGRVLRFLAPKGASTCKFWGTDIDEQAVEWCRRNLPLATWDVNGALPPLRYDTDSFDFIFAVSVFTHLDEQFQDLWLRELARVLRPGGVLLASVHGSAYEPLVKKGGEAVLASQGICSQVAQRGAAKLDGLPDFYQATFHTRDYIERVWCGPFELLAYRERGMNSRQDAVLLKKREA